MRPPLTKADIEMLKAMTPAERAAVPEVTREFLGESALRTMTPARQADVTEALAGATALIGALEAAEITHRDLDDVLIPVLDTVPGTTRLRQALTRLAHALAVQGPIRVALAGGPGSRWSASVAPHPDARRAGLGDMTVETLRPAGPQTRL